MRANLPRDPWTGEQHHLFSAERKEAADETADASRACNDDPAAHRATVRIPWMFWSKQCHLRFRFFERVAGDLRAYVGTKAGAC